MSESVLSQRSDIPPFYVMEVMRAAERLEATGKPVLHLEVGQPSTGAPAGALAQVRRLLATNPLGYTGAAGLPELRDKIVDWYRTRYDAAIGNDQVVVTTGASGSFVLTFLALFDHGDRVAIFEPGYPCYRNDLTALGVSAVSVPLDPDNSYHPSIQALEDLGPLDGVVVASPSNPTGTIIPNEKMAELSSWAARRGVKLIVDEIYHGITFGPAPATAASLLDTEPGSTSATTVVVNSFSKYFSMTGWRVGWVVATPDVAARIERLAQSLTIAPPTISQHCALAAFDCLDELDANVERYRVNRTVILDGLAAAGLTKIAPADGAFYVWCDVSHLEIESQVLASRWLNEIGVATTPGIDFDPVRGSDFIRFSYAGEASELRQAGDAIGAWIAAER